MPPETLEQKGSFGGDWWGLGIISFELITGRFPWKVSERAERAKRLVVCHHASSSAHNRSCFPRPQNIGTGNDDNLRDEIRNGKVVVPEFVSPNASELLKVQTCS